MLPPEEEDCPEFKALWVQAWDDITGQELDAAKVIEAMKPASLRLHTTRR